MTPVDSAGHLHDRDHYPDGPACWHCGATRGTHHRANLGLCAICYNRWMDNGYPAGGPGERRSGGRGWKRDDPLVLAEFYELDRPGEPGRSAELAQRFGVTRRTLTRWRRLREAEQARQARLEVAAQVTGRCRWRARLRRMRAQESGTDVEAELAALLAADLAATAAGGAGRVACFRA